MSRLERSISDVSSRRSIDLLLGVLKTELIRAMAEARLIASYIKLPATRNNRTVEPE